MYIIMVQTEWNGSTNRFILELIPSRRTVLHFHLIHKVLVTKRLQWSRILQFVNFPRTGFFFPQSINENNR